MNNRWGHLSNLWFSADTETPSREDNPSQTGSSVDRGEFRPVIKNFSFPLISLGHFYVFFFSPSLQPWAADLHTLAGRRGGLERRCPLPLHFFTLFLLCPLSSSLSTTASLSFRRPRTPFLHLEQDITHTRDCCLVPRHTFIWLLRMHLKYLRCIAVFHSRRSSYPSTFMLYCTVSLLVLAGCARIFVISHKRVWVCIHCMRSFIQHSGSFISANYKAAHPHFGPWVHVFTAEVLVTQWSRLLWVTAASVLQNRAWEIPGI